MIGGYLKSQIWELHNLLLISFDYLGRIHALWRLVQISFRGIFSQALQDWCLIFVVANKLYFMWNLLESYLVIYQYSLPFIFTNPKF